MNTFENILAGLLQGTEATVPIFVHSPEGILILNASETILASILFCASLQRSHTCRPSAA